MEKRIRVLAILRHENSLNIVQDYLETNNIDAVTIVLDPVEHSSGVDEAIEDIKSTIATGINALIAGTKVYDTLKLEKTDPPQRLIDFLLLLKEFGIGQTPVCLTHLSTMPNDLAHQINQTGINASWVENDNLKNDRMNNLGPLLMSVLS